MDYMVDHDSSESEDGDGDDTVKPLAATEIDPDESVDEDMPVLDENGQHNVEVIKKRDKALLKKWCRICGLVVLGCMFWMPIVGVGIIANGCNSEQRQIEKEFDSINVLSISVLKDRGDVDIEIEPKPTVQGGSFNTTTNTYGAGEMPSGKIKVDVTHYAATPEALAQIHTVMRQTCPQAAKCLLTIYNYWDQHFNSLFDCPRSTIKIRIPHIISQGSDGDIYRYDRELGEYVWVGTKMKVVEPAISVNITANQPSGWMMPLIGDIKITGKSDVILGDVNLVTNGGTVSLEQISANRIDVDAAAGAINFTMVSSPNISVMARASRVYGSTIPVLPFGNDRTIETGDLLLQYIDLERWREDDVRDRSYRSRIEGYMRPLYDQIPAGDRLIQSPENVKIGDLRVVSELGQIDIEHIVHGNIDIDVNGRSKTAADLDLSGMGGDVTLTMNAFEMQGLYDFNTDDGDITFELDCGDMEAITDIKRTCDDEEETDCPHADEVKGVYGRIGNVYDLRDFSPMNHRFYIDIEVQDRSGTSVDITLNMDCADLKRCPNDCSARGACNPDFGLCACQPSFFYNYTSVYYGSACEYMRCPNDCSGTGTCDRISGECTCWDRYYSADDHFPCTKVVCDDGPHPRSTNPDRPNPDAMECGRCHLPYNNSYCEPVDFMSPTAVFNLQLNWDALVRQNMFLADNETADATMYDPTSPAAIESNRMISAELNQLIAPLHLVVNPELVSIDCVIVESGLEGSWTTTHDESVGLGYLENVRDVGQSIAEVSCTRAEARTLVHEGYGQALALLNLTAGGAAITTDGLLPEQQASNGTEDGTRQLQTLMPVAVNINIELLCPNNCSAHGQCDLTTGRCHCEEGRFRDDCYFASCPGDLAECSGAGTCDYLTGRCHCIPGRAGDDCNNPDVDCPNDCTSAANGFCDRLTGVCTCTTYFMGEDCSQIISPCGEICPGRSFCNGLIGECECPPVTIRNRTYENVLTYGYGCMLAPCLMPVDDANATESTRETDCNAPTGNGLCDTYSGECVCNPGYLGLECEERECITSVDVYTNETVYCSGHGTCNFTSGECMCDSDHDQADCSRQLCPDDYTDTGFSDNCGADRHPHAYCNHDSGLCICEEGYVGRGRLLCALKLCPGPQQNACSGRSRGACNYTTGLCECLPGYTGELCELIFCPGDAGYPPPYWTETEVAARPKYRTAEPHRDACDGHGVCNPVDGLCTCDDRFSRGVDIEYRGIRSVEAASEFTCSYRLCPNHCSGNGICDFSTGICDCYMEPYTGMPLPQPACAMTVCPLGTASGLPCDARGDCNFATGECTCTILGASGPSCSYWVCLNDCWGQGRCDRNTGVCYCDDGWSGIDCGISTSDGGRRRQQNPEHLMKVTFVSAPRTYREQYEAHLTVPSTYASSLYVKALVTVQLMQVQNNSLYGSEPLLSKV
eukprot:SAG31_NODE_262_length_18842_cov_22.033346_12_plen_1436_part_00